MAGHANVGKTLSILFYFTCLAKKHNLKFAVFSSENEIGSLKDDIITMYTGKRISELSVQDFEYAHYWLNEHFKFFDADGFFNINKRLMNFKDIIEQVDKMPQDQSFTPDSIVIDPYNSLGRVEDMPKNQHQYDYTVMAQLRIWCKLNQKSCYILAHGVTEALRKTHPKDHDFAGYTIPLLAADIEGGGKFVNRSDDFVVIHRYTNHVSEWTKTEWHVVKVKNTKTGGKPTFKDNPVTLRALSNLSGFDVYIKKVSFAAPSECVNPMKDEVTFAEPPKPLPVNKNFDKSVEVAKAKIEAEDLPPMNEIDF